MGRNAHVMSEIETAGSGISVWRRRDCRKTEHILLFGKGQEKELNNVPYINLSRNQVFCFSVLMHNNDFNNHI